MIRIVFLPILISIVFIQCDQPVNDLNAKNEGSAAKCCSNKGKPNPSIVTEIICPYCDHKKSEILPGDVCVIKYTCENCKKELTPKAGDCCVYCTYGSHKCPSKQD